MLPVCCTGTGVTQDTQTTINNMSAAAGSGGSSDAVNSIPDTLSRLRAYFNSHITKSYAWRKAQLEGLVRMIEENETMWCDALKADLSKPYFEGSFTEVVISLTEIKATLKDLASWMQPEKAPTPLALVPGESYIMYEPYGVALIIGAFNYPVSHMSCTANPVLLSSLGRVD